MSLFRKLVGIFQAAGVALRKRLLGGESPVFVEDVFSTWLYTGNGSTQTITNGIDLSTKGGMVWIKSRSGAFSHNILDTVRGFNYSGTQTRRLDPSTTDSQADAAGNATQASPLTDGFSVTTSGGGAINFYNASGSTYASWTFRKQPKFFDIVTYTGNGTSQTISHNLASTPGCIFVKRTDTTANWTVYHRGLSSPNGIHLKLNLTNTQDGNNDMVNGTSSTTFSVGSEVAVNASGGTYVAYLFAHDAGGFGLTGTDNVISCGSFSDDASGNATVNLGFEPQWILQKRIDSAGNWFISDVMRGMTVSAAANLLRPNLSSAESEGGTIRPTATGFTVSGYPGSGTYIYIAIRRGPMKVPTSGASVFSPVQYTTSPEGFITGFPVDFGIAGNKAGTDKWYWQSRLHGAFLVSSASAAPEVGSGSAKFDMMNGYGTGFSTSYWADAFRRAPSFFDVVFYTGTGGASQNYSHSLGVVPELIIIKNRNRTSENWLVYHKDMGAQYYLSLNQTSAKGGPDSARFPLTPTSSVFTVGTDPDNGGSFNFVSYLFATCAGVSKVGSYTGTGTTLQVNCGFTAGARFVMIKRTDATSDWYVWDTARGIIAGNDPYLLLNTTAAEVTNTDYIDPYSPGFELSSTAPTALNASGGTYIFLAIA